MHYEINIAGKVHRLELEKTSQENSWLCQLDGREIACDAVQLDANTLSIVVGGESFQIRRENRAETQRILVNGRPYEVTIHDARSLKNRRRIAASNAGPLRLTASMPGKVVRVLANKGETVQAGAGLVVIEAMKMQNELRSPKDGTLKEVLAREGMNVNAGDVLAVLE